MIPCDICGKSGHVWFACPLRSTKPADWKPDRLTKSTVKARDAARSGSRCIPPPVDTKGRVAQPGSAPKHRSEATVSGSHPDASSEVHEPRAGSNPAPIPLIIGKRRGRPQTITDMKAYKADKERQRRARNKHG